VEQIGAARGVASGDACDRVDRSAYVRQSALTDDAIAVPKGVPE